MRKFWKRGEKGLGARLRAERPEAPAHLVESVRDRVERASRRPRSWSRVAFAGAVATMMLGTFASFGGISYASTATNAAFHTVKQIALQHKVFVNSAAKDQYGNPVTPSTPIGPTGNVEAAQATQATGTSGTLPFTGFSLLGTFIVSLMLVAAGVMLRRWERKRE